MRGSVHLCTNLSKNLQQQRIKTVFRSFLGSYFILPDFKMAKIVFFRNFGGIMPTSSMSVKNLVIPLRFQAMDISNKFLDLVSLQILRVRSGSLHSRSK